MTAASPFIKRLRAAAIKAAGRAAAAKTQVRAAKAQLKQARKLFKIEKRAAKQARREVDAASIVTRAPRPAATLQLKPAVRKVAAAKPLTAARRNSKLAAKTAAPKTAAPKTTAPKSAAVKSAPKKTKPPRAAKARAVTAPEAMRSAAEVAKSVIERLHAPPPVLPPTPVIPPGPPPSSGDAAMAPKET
jgi:hypothetical protein